MLSFILWYIVVTLIGVAVFPLGFRLLPGLPGRGYAAARTLGLLLWGYVYWLGGSLGTWGNDLGGLLFSLGVVLGASLWALRGVEVEAFREWWGAHRRAVIVGEVLFLAAFGGWALVRAANPDIVATEKPMELAFINAVLRSPAFPPLDPWLAGYAISYYYFGYVIVGMLAMITGVPGGVAFNLAVALIFGLAAQVAYGLVYNLLAAGYSRLPGLSLLGPFFVLVMGNVEGFLEVLHARGLFWRTVESGERVSAFWSWLNIKDLVNPPVEPLSWMPSRFLWWWRASRVVNDLNYNGAPIEVIDEFPFFSFLLADLHPHVLAIPFALLGVVLAMNVFFGGGDGELRIAGFALRISPPTFALAAVVLGGMAFMNTWDFPIYLALFAGAYVLRRVRAEGWGWARLGEFVTLGLAIGVVGGLLYFPFYIGFSSQAGGILPNVLNPTRGAHLWVMFGTLFVPLFAYLAHLWRGEGMRHSLRQGMLLAAGVAVGLWVFSLLLAGVIALLPEGAVGIQLLGAPDVPSLLGEAFYRRFASLAGVGTLVVLLGLGLALLLGRRPAGPVSFSLLLIVTAALLVIAPEFVYLRDQFGTRMNTVFKFYYQAWLLWGVAAAFGSALLFERLRGARRAGAAVLLAAVFVVGLTYPLLSLNTKTQGFNPPQGLRLDGTLHSAYLTEDDRAAVEWLRSAPLGTLVEAVGGSYSNYARISVHSGMPALLGWPGHESQWRGGTEEMGSREADVETIYRSNSWEETLALLQQYNVRYIYIGPLERSTYAVNESKFRRFLQPVFEQGQVVIFEVP